MRCTGVPQRGQGWPKRPCTAIPSWNAVTFSGNASPASARSARRPLRERVERAPSEDRLISVGCELAGQLERRQLRAMKNLVGVRVADAAEEMRIGQRALQRVALLLQRRARMLRALLVIGSSPPGSNDARASSPSTTCSDARFCVAASVSSSSPAAEVESREPDLARDGGAALPPLEPARDHQMKHEKERRPRSSQTIRLPMRRRPVTVRPVAAIERRLDRPQQKRRRQPHTFELRPDDARAQREEIQLDVGQLRHGSAPRRRRITAGRRAIDVLKRLQRVGMLSAVLSGR